MVMPTTMITVSVTATPTTTASDEENPLVIEGLDAVASEVEVVVMPWVAGGVLQSLNSLVFVVVVGCVHVLVVLWHIGVLPLVGCDVSAVLFSNTLKYVTIATDKQSLHKQTIQLVTPTVSQTTNFAITVDKGQKRL